MIRRTHMIQPSPRVRETTTISSPGSHLTPRKTLLYLLCGLVILLSVLASSPSAKKYLIKLLTPRRHRRIRSRSRVVLDGPEARGVALIPEVLDDGFNIPNVVHMIFGLEPNFGHIKFGLTHYLAVMAARMKIGPQFIKWHYRYSPEGIWWECVQNHF